MSLSGSREFSDDEVKSIRDYFNTHYMYVNDEGEKKIVENTTRAYSDIITYLYIEFQISTGFRISEILSIKWKDVMKDGEIKSTITLGKHVMKGKKYARSIYIPKSLRALLKEVHRIWPHIYTPPKEITDESYVFMCTGNKETHMHRSTLHKRLGFLFDRLCLRGKGKVSSHSFRKTCFNSFYEICDRDIIKTATLTGHRKLDTLQHYLSGKINEKQIQALLDR